MDLDFIHSLEEHDVRVIEHAGHSVIWRQEGERFYRLVVAEGHWLPWDEYGREAAQNQIEKDLRNGEV